MLHPHGGVLEDLGEERAVILNADPRRPEPRLDLISPEIRRQHALKRRDVHRQPWVLLGAGAGLLELDAHVPRQVLRGRNQPGVLWVLVDQLAKLAAGIHPGPA